MNDENDKPKNPPEDDWGMTSPKLKMPQNHPPPSDDFDKTAPNVDIPRHQTLSPSHATDDWAMNPNDGIPIGEKDDGWEMPQPVFRVSDGVRAAPTPQIPPDPFDKSAPEVDFSVGHGDVTNKTAPYLSPDENKPPAAVQPQAAKTAASPKKSSKMPLILGGLFLMFFIAAGFLVGVYFLFLNRNEPATAMKKPQERNENTASNSNSVSTSAPALSSETPKQIEYKTTMMLVPAGEFTMGSDDGEDISKPAHKVTVPAFYIDKYEVTNAQYKTFCDETKKNYPNNQYWNENYFLSRPDAPVVGVSFDDARAYAAWAGKRLPTEEEWEKAASWDEKTQAKREYPWGNEFDGEYAAFNLSEPSDVGKYASGASSCGAMDMAGNVSEWVDAFFKPYPNSAAKSDEFGEKNRVVRGGYFGSKANDRLKTTKRIYIPPAFVAEGETASYIGFRCAISADDPRLKTQGK